MTRKDIKIIDKFLGKEPEWELLFNGEVIATIRQCNIKEDFRYWQGLIGYDLPANKSGRRWTGFRLRPKLDKDWNTVVEAVRKLESEDPIISGALDNFHHKTLPVCLDLIVETLRFLKDYRKRKCFYTLRPSYLDSVELTETKEVHGERWTQYHRRFIDQMTDDISLFISQTWYLIEKLPELWDTLGRELWEVRNGRESTLTPNEHLTSEMIEVLTYFMKSLGSVDCYIIDQQLTID